MTLLKVFLKMIAVILLAGACAGVILLSAFSFWTVSTLSKASQAKISKERNFDPNVQELARLSEAYIEELQSFTELSQELAKKKMPPFCSSLCKESSFELEKFSADRANYLKDFYHVHKAQALNDPQFRLKIEELSVLNKVFPKDLREWLDEIFDNSDSDKRLARAFHFEVLLVKNLFVLPKRWHELQKENQKLQVLRDLMKACQSENDSDEKLDKKLIEECKNQF
ncbi:MAG TPA: hypothetical protein VN132_10895 [Bdellovibrio sp.]|nr:hypothetical protein [Bdellovibrio sp.]